MKAALETYHARMQRALDHIDRHLDGDLDLEAVSGVAAFSKYPFHRQFISTFGLSVHRFVIPQVSRLGDVADGLRAVRQSQEQADADYLYPDDVTIRDVPPTPVAMLEHRGDRATIGDTIQRFVAWRKATGLSPETSPTFMVFRSERCPENPADYSMDLCGGSPNRRTLRLVRRPDRGFPRQPRDRMD